MWIVVSTIVFHSILEAVLVGLSFAAVARRFDLRLSLLQSFLVLLPLFLLFAVYYLPAIDALNARIVIGNQAIAKEIGPGTPIVLRELFRFGISDPVAWGIQAAIATTVARWSNHVT